MDLDTIDNGLFRDATPEKVAEMRSKVVEYAANIDQSYQYLHNAATELKGGVSRDRAKQLAEFILELTPRLREATPNLAAMTAGYFLAEMRVKADQHAARVQDGLQPDETSHEFMRRLSGKGPIAV